MVRRSSTSIGSVRSVVAIYSMGDRSHFCHPGRRGVISPCTERQTAPPHYLAWIGPCCILLDRLVPSSRNILSTFRNIQQNLWCPRSRNRAHDLALLDGLCVAIGRGTECGTGQAESWWQTGSGLTQGFC